MGLGRNWRTYRPGGGQCQRAPSSDLTHEQLFFIAYAQEFCVYATPQFAAAVIGKETAHAPDATRVNTTLSLDPNFSRAFACTPPPDAAQCDVW
ncbi:MAG: hypothetical protein K0V04_35095 [Deltaproteobacteria bacterium]|nr:hypothetical protein [Deltaproteobacteria bacterium]